MSEGNIRWYQTTWGIILIGLGAAALAIIIAFIVLILRYTWIIKHGGAEDLAKQVRASFTALSGSSNQKAAIDRTALEQSAAPLLGSPSAPITIVEFVDFKCPNCKAAAPIMQELLAKNSSRVKLLVRHFPIESLHPGASRLALVAECANEQGAFWPAYNLLFNRQDNITSEVSDEEVSSLASSFLIDQPKLLACVKSAKAKMVVDKDYSDAIGFGVRGTPTFFVNGEKVEGVVPLSSWQSLIDQYNQ